MDKEKGGDKGRPKKSAFAVLLQASPRANADLRKDQTKKRRLTDSGELGLSTCPICQGTFPASYLNQHVDSCLEKSADRERKQAAPALLAKTDQKEIQEQHDPPGLAQTAEAVDISESEKGEADADAFSRLMQRQRSHSNIHNFYLEKLPGDSFKWHWFMTSGSSDTKMMAHLNPSNLAPSKEAEFAKGAVNSQVRRVFGGPLTDNQAQVQVPDASTNIKNAAASSLIRSLNKDSGDVKHAQSGMRPCEPSELKSKRMEDTKDKHTSKVAGNSLPSENQTEEPKTNGIETENNWQHLPQARWHAMTQMLASKIGGPPKLKIAVRLLTNLAPGEGGAVTWEDRDLQSNAARGQSFHGSISVLKSAMQKNVRLCRPTQAVRCGMHILKEDASEFLRRSAVICLEDSILHPALPIIVWCMAAHSKGYTLGRVALTRCLAILFHIAHSPIKDSLILEGSRKYRSSLDLFEHAPGLTGDHVVLVRCIILRAAYGGMGGDIQLLKGFAQLWADRFVGITSFKEGEKPSESTKSWQSCLWENVTISHDFANSQDGTYQLELISPVDKEDIPASAVDFHVSSIVEELLNNDKILAKAKDLKRDASHLLRQSMWKFRSGLSNKNVKFNDISASTKEVGLEELKEFWDTASPIVEAWAEDFIAKRFY